MADFITPNLEYTEPEDGGSVNTWGAKLNANIRKQDLDIHARFKRSGDTMSGPLGVVAGTAAAPGVFISGDADTGYYSPGPDMVGIATGGVGRFVLSNTLLSLAVGLMVSGSTALQAASATTFSTSSLATLASLSTSSATITGGTINGVVIGGSTPAAGTFTALTSTGNALVGGNLSVAGNFTVNGTTTTVNSTVVTIDDPVFTLGGDTAPTVDDNKDRGIEFRWHNGTAAKVGFFGFDDSTGYFGFIPDATNTSEVFSGTLGDFQATNFRGNLIGATATLSGNLTLNGGTANGVAYLDGSKILSTGSALTFDGSRLSVNGNIIKANEGLIRDVATGFVAISGGTSVNTSTANGGGVVLGYGNSHATLPGKVLIGAGDVAGGIVEITTANVTRQIWDRAGNSALGLTPSVYSVGKALEVGFAGNALFGATAGQLNLMQNAYFDGNFRYASTGAASYFQQLSGASLWYSAASGTAGAVISDFATPKMTLTQGGNLLLGTTTDSGERFTAVRGTSATLPFAHVASFARGADDNFRISAYNGSATNAAGQIAVRFGLSHGSVYNSGISFIRGEAATDGYLSLDANGLEAVRITSARDFVIGATAPINSHKLTVNASGLNGGIVKTNDPVNQCFSAWNASTTGDSRFIEFATEGSYTARGVIDYNRTGGLVRYNTTSDQTLKTLIGDAPQEKSLTILRETRLREYYWNDDPDQKPQITPFAQELHQTFPGAVSVGGWYDEVIPAVTERVLVSEGVQEVQDAEGNVLIPGQDPVYETVVIEPEHTVQKYRPWGVDKTAFSFHLVAGFQYHDQRIAELQARIEALEAA